MSDQQQASGDSPAPGAAAATPGAEAVAARPAGAEEPRTASVPKETGTDSAGTGTGTADDADDADDADGSGEAPDGERAGEKADEKVEGNGKTGKDAKGTGGSARGEGATDDKGGARALSAAAAGEHHRAVATAAAGKGATGATGSAVGRPRKPVLAGAALAGAVLVAVPLLITVAGRDEERKTVDSTAADTVLNEVDDPAGVFATQSPSPSKSAPGKEKKTRSAAPPAEKAAAAPSAEPSPSPSRKKKAEAEAEEKGKEKEKAAVAKKATDTLPAVLTRVLIKNNTNRTCVDVPGFTSGRQDGPVTHATCNSNTDDNQLWNVEQRYAGAGPGGVPLFQIRNVMDGMCLDLPGYQGVGGATKVTEFPCDGSTNDNQLWWLDKQSDGKFWIRNAASNNQCLDSYGVDDRTRDLIVWPCAPEGRNNHEWIFTRS